MENQSLNLEKGSERKEKGSVDPISVPSPGVSAGFSGLTIREEEVMEEDTAASPSNNRSVDQQPRTEDIETLSEGFTRVVVYRKLKIPGSGKKRIKKMMLEGHTWREALTTEVQRIQDQGPHRPRPSKAEAGAPDPNAADLVQEAIDAAIKKSGDPKGEKKHLRDKATRPNEVEGQRTNKPSNPETRGPKGTKPTTGRIEKDKVPSKSKPGGRRTWRTSIKGGSGAADTASMKRPTPRQPHRPGKAETVKNRKTGICRPNNDRDSGREERPKRPRSEGSTPEGTSTAKKAREEGHRIPLPTKTYSQVAAGIKIGVCHKNFPEVLLEEKDMKAFEGAIREAIKTAIEGPYRPSFRGIKRNAGWIMVICSDQDTAKWLKETVSTPKFLGDTPLRTMEEGDFPRPRVIVGYFPNSLEEDSEGIIAILAAQNRDLCTQHWRVLRREVQGRIVAITFGVDEASARNFTGKEMMVNYLFNQARLRLVARDKGQQATKNPEVSEQAESTSKEEAKHPGTSLEGSREINDPIMEITNQPEELGNKPVEATSKTGLCGEMAGEGAGSNTPKS